MVILRNKSSIGALISVAKISLLILCFNSSVNAQQHPFEEISNHHKNRLSISLTSYTANRLQINSENDHLLNSNRAFSGELAVLYDYYLSKRLFITTGVGIGVVPFNFSFEIPSEQIEVLEAASLDLHFFSYDLYYANLPLLINYESFSKDRIAWIISTGASYSRMYNPNYQIGVGLSVYDDQTLETFELFQFDLFEAADHHHFNFLIGVNASLKTKKGRRWMFGFISQIGTSVGQGNYQFLNVKDPSQGTVELGFNWIGLRTTYGFRTKEYKMIQASKANRKVEN